MYHVIHIGMNSDALKQLDALRKAYPNLYNRKDILLQLVEEAHAKLAAETAKAPKLKLAA
jgi:hypothetical protein